jgi:hypothetical protein
MLWVDIVLLCENTEFILNPYFFKSINLTEGIKSLDPAFLKKIWKPDLLIGEGFAYC